MNENYPFITTFYSYKGGVGRSLAMLNVAYALASRGRHVLMVDMDLEAPGISGYMRRTGEVDGHSKHDAIDLVAWACRVADLPPETSNSELLATAPPFAETHLSVPIEKRKPLKPRYGTVGRIDVIGVNDDQNYFNRLAALNLHAKSRAQLIAAGEALRVYFKSQRVPIDNPDYYPPDAPNSCPYDYVLIDSRTGTTEIGGLCVGPLADRLVVVTGLNDQNITGTHHFLTELGLITPRDKVAQAWDSADPPADEADAPPRLGPKPTILVASPVPFGEIRFKRQRLAKLAKTLGQAVASKLSYHPQLALMESIFVREYKDEYLASEYHDLTSEIMRTVTDHAGQLVVLSDKYRQDGQVVPAVEAALRAVYHRSDLFAILMNLANAPSENSNFNLETDADFIAIDRLYRALTQPKGPELHIGYSRWGNMLSDWGDSNVGAKLRNRRREEAIDRFSTVIEMKDAPTDAKATALVNRGLAYAQLKPPQTDQAIVDYTTVIEMEDTSTDVKAGALNNRGVAYGKLDPPQTDKKIADCTAVIEMNDAPPQQKAAALANRSVAYGKLDPPQTDKKIADYTSVIEMKDAPPDQKAQSLVNRGITYRHLDPPQTNKEIADYTAVIQMPDAPPDQKAKALIGHGVAFGKLDPPQTDQAIADYTTVIEMEDAPPDMKALAHGNLGWQSYIDNRLEQAIESSRTALALDPTIARIRGNLALAHLRVGQTSLALKEYRRAIDDLDDVEELDDLMTDLQKALESYDGLESTTEILSWIEARRTILEQKS